MERCCHTADHSLSAESCNGTTLQRHPLQIFALGHSRLLELAVISTACPRVWPVCKGSSISRRLFRLIHSLQPRYSASFVAAAETGIMSLSFNRGPLVTFRVDHQRSVRLYL